MKKIWELRENEKLLGEAAASYITKHMIVMPKPNPGKLHITDQRALATADGKSHKLTGMFTKKLASALEQAGVRKA